MGCTYLHEANVPSSASEKAVHRGTIGHWQRCMKLSTTPVLKLVVLKRNNTVHSKCQLQITGLPKDDGQNDEINFICCLNYFMCLYMLFW